MSRAAALASRAAQLLVSRRGRAVAVVAGFAAVTLVTALIAYPSIHTVLYEDEAYMLTSLQSFLDRGNLYGDVYAQYGPFYFEFWTGLYSVFGIPFDQNAGRLATLVVWVLCGVGLGLATRRITGSILLGLAVQMMSFSALGVMVNEPMHPGGLICLLLALAVLIASFVGPRPSVWPMALLGAVVAAMLLIKINVGAFALGALALVAVCSYQVFSSRRWPRPAVEVGFVLLPLLLMTGEFGNAWARHYAVHVSLAALALVIVLRARAVEQRDREELWWVGGGLLAVALTSCLAVLGSGTSPGGLVEGLVLQPLGQGEAFTLPLLLSGRTWLFDAIGLSGAIAYWYVARKRPGAPGRPWVAIVSLVSVLIGVELALSVIGRTLPADSSGLGGGPYALLAFVWLALVPISPGSRPRFAFARLLLPPLALLQTLHAFPVAGSQILWGSFLLIPVGAICVAEGLRGLRALLDDEVERRALTAVGALAAVALGYFVVNATLREPLRNARASYDALEPLDLPGAESVRLEPGQAELYRAVTGVLDRNCATFVSEPGMYAFNIWTGRKPPTGFNATAWMALFSDAQQKRVIEEIRSVEDLCLLRNVALAEGWSRGPVPQGRLTRYLEREFDRSVATIGPYEVLRREGGNRG